MYPIEFVVYLVIFIISMMNIFGDVNIYSLTQAKTVAINSGAALIAIFAPLIVELITKKKLSPFIDFVVAVALFLAIFLGEACQCYLNVSGWDKMLHFFATAAIAVFGYVVAKNSLNKLHPEEDKSRSKIIMSLVFAFFFAVALESMWEIYEFTMDSLTGTNMQKYLPGAFYDSITADGTLSLTADEIIAFFSTEEGYTYALQDTMLDIITDVGGGLFGCLAAYLVFRFKPEWQDKVLFIKEKKEEQAEAEPEVVAVTDNNDSQNITEDVNEITYDAIELTEEFIEEENQQN